MEFHLSFPSAPSVVKFLGKTQGGIILNTLDRNFFTESQLTQCPLYPGNFGVPVCQIFKKKIIEGQVCYEAGFNRRESTEEWKKDLLGGLSLVIDTNHEYDVQKLLKKESHPTLRHPEQYYAYKRSRDLGLTVSFKSTISRTRMTYGGVQEYLLCK